MLKKDSGEVKKALTKIPRKSPTFWSRSFCLLSSCGAPIEVIKQYIEEQGQKNEKTEGL